MRPIALTLLIVLTACASDGAGNTTAPTATTVPTTSTQPPTTTTTSTPTTSTNPPASTTIDPLAPGGSGCTPGSAELPDGLWFGVVADYDESGIAFDLACWFTGDAAAAAAEEDGEESPPPNDYYVRNENPELRVLAVDDDTPVTWYPTGDPNDAVTGTFAEWIAFLDGQDFRNSVWLTVTAGRVSLIEEQWVP